MASSALSGALLRGGGGKLSVLSANAAPPKWSFGTAARFKLSKDEDSRRRGTNSAPALQVNMSAMSTCAGDADSVEADTDSGASGELPSRRLKHNASQQSWASMDATFSMCNSTKAPRLDGSLERTILPRQRARFPCGKSYDAAETMGSSAAVSFMHAPRYSFGGGKSRQEKPKATSETRRRAQAAPPAKQQHHKKAKVQLCRGFGSEVRLRYRGGAMELPISPGPAAYDMPRECDAIAEWMPSSLLPWGKRTAQRPQIRNPTATDAGPGEYIADHGFHFSRPGALIGQQLPDLHPPSIQPPPTAYDLPTSIGQGVSCVMGSGTRSGLRPNSVPGPGTYDPKPEDGSYPHAAHTVFGDERRPLMGDDVDPDEPPGPGVYKVREDPLQNGVLTRAWPTDAKLKRIAGMGPLGVPAPDAYDIVRPPGKQIGIHFPLDRPVEKRPGPTDYDPGVESQWTRNPAANSVRYTAPRRSPFEQFSDTQKSSEEMIKRCAEEVAKLAEEERSLDPSLKEEEPAFFTSGPSHSFGARRPMIGPPLDDVPLRAAYSSIP